MSILARTTSALNTDGATAPADQYDHEISLIDHTKPDDDLLSPQETDLELPTPLSTTSSGDPLRHIWTREGLQRELQRRKYARYQEDRVIQSDRPAAQKRQTAGTNEELPTVHESTTNDFVTPGSEDADRDATASIRKRDTIRHHTSWVKDVVKDTVRGRRLKHHHSDAESLFDVLYENQRGAFFCGVPRFSSKSLLNFDPPPWQTHTFHPSPVDITNAQVPDPSWVWANGWNNWYVDMSFGLKEPIGPKKTDRPAVRARGDTDEEGWRYSFAFGQRGRWVWHGTHPWFHSFVRRRKWVRLRVKRGHALAPEGAKMKHKVENEGHMLNADYFTIHNSKRPASRYTEGTGGSVRSDDKRYSTITSKGWSKADAAIEDEAVEVKDMPSLLRALRGAAIDREKIAAVRLFLDNGGDELHYLADNMREIMLLLIFQSSRQQLLSILSRRLQQTKKGHDKAKHKAKARESTDAGENSDSKVIENLQRAVAAAEDECRQLDYWGSTQGTSGSKTDAAHDHSDECDEEDEDNEAPIGKTTIFNDDVDGRGPGKLARGDTADLQSLAAPDRPAEADQGVGAVLQSAPGDIEGQEQDSTGSDEDTLPGEHPVPILDEELPEDSGNDLAVGLSSSPELVRFETAHEEAEDGEEPAKDTGGADDGLSKWSAGPDS